MEFHIPYANDNNDDDDDLMMITYSVWGAGAKDETGSRWDGGGGGRVFKCLAFHLHTNIEHWISTCLSVQMFSISSLYNQVMVFYVSRVIFHSGGAWSDSGDVVLTRETWHHPSEKPD